MSLESSCDRFIRRSGSGQKGLRCADLMVLERKFEMAPQNLVGSIADNALAVALHKINI